MIAPAQIGSYRIERLLGVGSFATVWLGFDAALGARVAIKVLADNWSHDLRVRERFLDEGRLLWQLDHERITRVYGVGELADGRPYLAMAWADGGSLRDRLAPGPLPAGPGLRLLREIALGVAVLHQRGIVHRDLTPGNVLFRSRPESADRPGRSDEAVLIADLGLAKALAAASGLTARAGTPGYMAPEQDDPFAVVDARADVYGLGRLGVRLLGVPTPGRPDGPLRLGDGVPAGLAGVLRRATAYAAADRFADAGAFIAALDRAAGGSGPTRPARSPGRRPNRGRAAASAVALLAMLAGVLAAVPGDTVAPPERVVPPVGTDVTGRITVALPAGWRAVGTGWAGRPGPDGQLEPALVMSPDPQRWPDQADMPGAFVGLSPTIAVLSTAAEYLATRNHSSCPLSSVRTGRYGGAEWFIAEFGRCATGKPTLVEATSTAPSGLVYVQLAPPADSGPAFVGSVLAGVRVS